MKPLNEDQLQLIEALVKSPVFDALKALIESYREQCISELMSEKNPSKLFEIQGRLIGVNVVQTLPLVRAQQLEAKRKKDKEKEEEAQKQERARKPR